MTAPADSAGPAEPSARPERPRPPALAAAGTRLRLDPRTRQPSPRLVIGGSPVRALRLSAAGARMLQRWQQGEAVNADPAARELATRLLDSGLAHPSPPPRGPGPADVGGPGPADVGGPGPADVGGPGPADVGGPGPADVTAVIPVRDRPHGLETTVASLGPLGAVVVVDDGSLDAAAVRGAAGQGASLIRLPVSRGPAAARNAGWPTADTAIVAFIDADCVAHPGWIDALLPYFADERVGAVAPRVLAATAPGTPLSLAAYEHHHSPLDLGVRQAPVRPRSWVPYVPTACLLVRRACLASVGGFDEELRAGEDVDLVWRLVDAGWSVRYQPQALVDHPTRGSWPAWAAQRYQYGRSAAALAKRHGDAVAPLDVSAWSVGAWTLGAVVQPVLGLAVALWSTARLIRRAESLPRLDLVRLAVGGHVRSGGALARVLGREWWPLSVVAALVWPRSRRALAVATVVPPLWEWARIRPPVDPLRWGALRVADGLAYGTGVWAGCIAARSFRALRPRLGSTRNPPPPRGTVGL